MKVFYKRELKIGTVSMDKYYSDGTPMLIPLYKIEFDDGSAVFTADYHEFDFVSE